MSRFYIGGRDTISGRPLRVAVEDGLIAELGPGSDDDTAWISPGLIDLQVNGYRGYDLNAGTADEATVANLATALRRVGVTTFLPTITTASEVAIVSALRAIASARASDALLAYMIPYVHVEGPHLSPEDGPRGAHPRSQIRPPDLAEFNRWQEASGGLVGMVTVSPHYEGACDYIRAVRSAGVHVALGHTNATSDAVKAAIDAGAVLSTHLGNGAAASLPRHPNFIWTQLADDRLMASFIADGHHLPADTFKAMLRAKGMDRSILVSDAVALGGMPPGLYDQPIGARVQLTADGRLGIAGTPFLAGAARPLADDVALAVQMGELSLSEALRLATANPGRFVGRRGLLEVGASADLILFSWRPGMTRLQIEQTFVRGEERA